MVVRRQYSNSEWVLITEESVGKYAVELTIYITLSQDNGIYTADVNKAFKFSSKKEAEKLREVLELVNFRAEEIPDVLRRGEDEYYEENVTRG